MTTEALLCGLQAVLQALRGQHSQVEVVWLSGARSDRRTDEVIELAKAADVRLERVSRDHLDQIAGGVHHQGVVAQCRLPPSGNERDLPVFLEKLNGVPLLLVLDGVQDPHNLGACLRCADGAGVHAVILPQDRAASVTASVRRVASGAAETVPIFRVTNISRVLRQFQKAGIWLVGASQEATTSIFEADLSGPLALIMGGEEKGLRRLTKAHCDALVKIPMLGSIASLNVAAATAVCLYEALRCRQVRDA
ncbi:MAG: 23S rRNA (guanosine(2251)-2'-O)-methyltransferase RlmB [Gammaproteobacteria bacterium]|jgi:23S rRNA (guanosine2251-2'-O)-methyltransferase|nr:23S rRNA (guanosine(2251)-2'-O)-methyltransferase RlmB [Gammaproteobacteria bacterium]